MIVLILINDHQINLPIPIKNASNPSFLNCLIVKPLLASKAFPVTILTPKFCIRLISYSTTSYGNRNCGISEELYLNNIFKI